MRDLTIIFRTPSQIEADVIKGLLETHGIEALVTSDLSRTAFPFSSNELRLSVSDDEAERAQQIIDSHRDEVGSGRVVPFGSEFEPLERIIGYRFRDRGLLEHALTHRSRVHEDASGGVIDNESLEFLGDSILGFVIADMLFREFPQHNEGQKSKLKASIVSATSLGRLGERIGLGDYLILGRGEEKTGGRQKLALDRRRLRGAHRGDLPRRRHRSGAGVHRAAVRRAHRGSAPHRRARRPSPRTTSQRCRSGCSRTTAGSRSIGSPRKWGPRIAGASRSKCWSAASRWRAPKGRARRKRRRRPPRRRS